jgi:hypothetical protein
VFITATAFRQQIIEGKAGQRAQIAVLLQPLLELFILLGPDAAAGDDPAIVGLPVREAGVNDTGALAERAVRTQRQRLSRDGRCVRTFL